MAPVSETIEITASPHDVYEYVADLRNLPLWQESVERVALTATTAEVGALLSEKHTGEESSSAYVVADCAPDELLVLVGVEGPVRPEHTLHLEPILEGRSTRVEYAVDYDADGLSKVAAARAKRHARQELRADLEHLKHEIEAGESTAAHLPDPRVSDIDGAAGPVAPTTGPEPASEAEAAPGSWREKGEGVVPPIRFY
jgi:uncharacterized membrane protein